jgi:hypothetical protein
VNRWAEVEGGKGTAHLVGVSSGVLLTAAICGRAIRGPIVLAKTDTRRCSNCLRRDESAKTLMHVLLGDEAKPTKKVPSNICPGCCYSDGRENRDDGTWICWRCGDEGENE